MKKLTIVVGLGIIAVFAAVIWWKNGILPVNASDKTPQIFVIKKGEGVREIASSLKVKGLIRDPIVFFLLTKKLGLDKEIQAGDFRLNPSMTLEQAIQALTHGMIDVWITIPEGLRSEEIAGIFKKNLPNYKNSWRDALTSQDGYLFPDTYLIPRNADVNLVVSLMKKNFAIKFASLQKNGTNTLTDKQVVILASIIEREAKFEKDRPLVASVLINRLNQNMPLQADATVQYALGYQEADKTWWKKNLTSEDLKINSPYNTYKQLGLPKAPISNPGLSALDAAMNPAETSYLYYVSDKTGHLHFEKTLKEHYADIKKYGL